MHRFSAVPHQKCYVMGFHDGPGIHHQSHVGSQTFRNQVLMQGAHGEQDRNRHPFPTDRPIRHDEDVETLLHRIHGLSAESRQPGFHAGAAPGNRISDVHHPAAEFSCRVVCNSVQFRHVLFHQNRLRDFNAPRRIHVVHVQKVRLGADKTDETRHQRFPNRINRGIRNLSKELLKVVKKRLVFLRQHRQSRVVTHAAQRFAAFFRHRHQHDVHVFLRERKGFLQFEETLGRHAFFFGFRVGTRQVRQPQIESLHPFAVGFGKRNLILDLRVFDDAALNRVDEEHLPRFNTPLFPDSGFRHRNGARFAGENHLIIVRQQEPRRTQSVAIKRRPDLPPVGENNGGRPVPRFHHRRIVGIKRLSIRIHHRRLFPRFRHEHRHSLT